tara:strand:+ start:3339 stop:3569 length:231 start_codon:yes stop_codon:yes gene_type:complete
MKENPEPNSLSTVLKECNKLVDELRAKLQDKCQEVLKLRKDNDILQTDNDIKDYELKLLKNHIESEKRDTRRYKND